jgi:hypothetical protein
MMVEVMMGVGKFLNCRVPEVILSCDYYCLFLHFLMVNQVSGGICLCLYDFVRII